MRRCGPCSIWSFPRSRGDRPHLTMDGAAQLAFPPLARGSTPCMQDEERRVLVSPARAGIDPHWLPVEPSHPGFPRSRGDRPHLTMDGATQLAFPPLARGSTGFHCSFPRSRGDRPRIPSARGAPFPICETPARLTTADMIQITRTICCSETPRDRVLTPIMRHMTSRTHDPYRGLNNSDRRGQAEVENMRKLITAVATATTLLAGSVIWKAEAAPATGVGSMPPLTKSYSPFEGVGCRCTCTCRHGGLRYDNYPWRRPFLLQRML